MLTYDAYHMPTNLQEALALWRDAPKGSKLICGATDILPWAREGRAGDIHLPMLLDVTRIAELQGYTIDNERLRLGANTVYQDFLRDTVLRENLPCMPYCAIWFADDQIREQASLAGNLVNASPASDGTPPVIALNGEIELARLEGREIYKRKVKVEDFIEGPGRTQLASNEIVTAVYLDAMRGYGGSFQKVGHRRSLVISVACCAALVKTDPSGTTFEDVRLALGGVGPGPMRLYDIESALRGQPVGDDIINEVSLQVAERVASRSRKDYRRDVVTGFVKAAIKEAVLDQPAIKIKSTDTGGAAHV